MKQPAVEIAVKRNGPPGVVLVGCGAAARERFVPVLQALQQRGALRVSSVVDAENGGRAWCHQQFPDAIPLSSLDAVVAPPDTLVIIATPTRWHASQTSAAVKRGWHVLCATPFATTPREAAQLVSTAHQHERILAVDLPHRFFPAARYLRTLCHDHLLGPPVAFRIHDGHTRTAPAEPIAGEKFEAPDGVLTDLGTRALDLLTWWLGSVTVKQYADDAMGGVEANASIELEFNGGLTGSVHLSRDWTTAQTYTVVFERGIVRWDASTADRVTVQLASTPHAVQGNLVTPLSARHSLPTESLIGTTSGALAAEIENILGAMTRRELLRVPAAEALHAMHVIEDCYARRMPLPQPWLAQNEAVNARAFAPPPELRRP